MFTRFKLVFVFSVIVLLSACGDSEASRKQALREAAAAEELSAYGPAEVQRYWRAKIALQIAISLLETPERIEELRSRVDAVDVSPELLEQYKDVQLAVSYRSSYGDK